jgi:Glycosyl hydrolase family 3 C-terminal domain
LDGASGARGCRPAGWSSPTGSRWPTRCRSRSAPPGPRPDHRQRAHAVERQRRAVVQLTAGTPASIRVEYIANTGFGLSGSLQLGWQAPDPALVQQAVDAARSADAAVVVNDVRTEGADLSSLAVPGDGRADRRVAAANPRTIVVLNTGVPALMPWVDRVTGAVEAWYSGQENGNATAAVLFGVNPSGKLPVTFPRNDQQGPPTTPDRFPGTNGTARNDEGVFVAYGWNDAKAEQPLLPFGHGLSYTSFHYDRLKVNARGAHCPAGHAARHEHRLAGRCRTRPAPPRRPSGRGRAAAPAARLPEGPARPGPTPEREFPAQRTRSRHLKRGGQPLGHLPGHLPRDAWQPVPRHPAARRLPDRPRPWPRP